MAESKIPHHKREIMIVPMRFFDIAITNRSGVGAYYAEFRYTIPEGYTAIAINLADFFGASASFTLGVKSNEPKIIAMSDVPQTVTKIVATLILLAD